MNLQTIAFVGLLVLEIFALPVIAATPINCELLDANQVTICYRVQPQAVPPSSLDNALTQLGLDPIAASKTKKFFNFLPELITGYATDSLQEIAEKSITGELPKTKLPFKVINWVKTVDNVKQTGDEFTKWYTVHSDPNTKPVDKAKSNVQLYEGSMSTLSGLLPPGFSQIATGLTKIVTLTLEADLEKTELENQQFETEMNKIMGNMSQTMESTWQQYGTNVQNKTLIASVMTNDQLMDHVLGIATGPNGESLQTEPDPSILNYLPGEQRKELYKQMLTESIQGNLPVSVQEIKSIQRKFPLGSAVMVKHSPVYVLIRDPQGKQYGVNPETQDIVCEDEAVFCSPLFTHYDPQLITTPALLEGNYEITVYGFEDGNFTFSFMAFNDDYNLESEQDIHGFVRKGQILKGTIEIQRTENNFTVSQLELKPTPESFQVSLGPALVPFKVLAIEPDENKIFRTQKPIIKIGFNKPPGENNSLTGLVTNERGENVVGMTLIENTTVTFIPAKPLDEGTYQIAVSNWKDMIGLKLSNILKRTFKVVRKTEKLLKFAISKPAIYRLTRRVHVKNMGAGTAGDISFKDPLLKSVYPNLFVKYEGTNVEPYEISRDPYENIWTYRKINSVPSGESINIDTNYIVFLFGVDYFDYVNFEGLKTANTSLTSDEFTQSNGCVESNNDEIIQKAKEIVKQTMNPYEKAQKLYNWVIKNIHYQFAGDGSSGKALQTLQTKKAVCYGYTCLYTALLRASNVPAKYTESITVKNTGAERHASSEFFLQGFGWLPVDATWGHKINDWFLVTDSTHVIILESNPPEYGGWYTFQGESIDVNEIWSAEILDANALWDKSIKTLNNAITATDFKREMIEKLPPKIRVQIQPREHSEIENSNSNVITLEFIETPLEHLELSRSLDEESWILQKATDHYFEIASVDSNEFVNKRLTDLERNAYTSLLEESKLQVQQYREDIERTKTEYEKEKSERQEKVRKQGVTVFDIVDTEKDRKNEIESQLSKIDQNIGTAEQFLNKTRYAEFQNVFRSIVEDMTNISRSKAELEFGYQNQMNWMNQSLNRAPENNIGVPLESTDLTETNMEGNIPREIDKKRNSITESPGELTSTEWLIVLFVLALYLGWIIAFLHCLLKKEFNHLNRWIWLLILLSTFLFLAIGGVLYLILEWKQKKKRNEQTNGFLRS